jgi:predicted AAA+ superfamily ATPase
MKRLPYISIKQALFQGDTIIIYGARQTGKTTLCKELLKEYPDGQYFNCDLLRIQEQLEQRNLEQLKQLVGKASLVVFDEAQRVKNIGITLKIIHDMMPEVQVIATGSSSFELANTLQEPLTGRAKIFTLYPISTQEYSDHYSSWQTLENRDRFLQLGMYPEILTLDALSAQEKLEQLTGSYLYQDILTFEQIKKSDIVIKILKLLAFQIGSEVHYHEIAQKLGVSAHTIQKYIKILEDTFIIFRLTAFSKNLRKEVTKSVKVYFWDLGIRNSIIHNFQPLHLRDDFGALFENFFIAERLKFLAYTKQKANVYFWRTYDQQEIDYIEESNGQLTAFECKWNPNKKVRLPKIFVQTYQNVTFKTVNRENFMQYVTQ